LIIKIFIGCDHVAVDLKKTIVNLLNEKNHSIEDIGVHSNHRVDYPGIAFEVAENVLNHDGSQGILICGTGIGMAIAANKVKGIRAAVCSESYSAGMSKMHNDTNILCFGSRVIGSEVAKEIVNIWIASSYEEGRHATRVKMIDERD
jgi:ribose 5-phosphate isomerase B